MLRPLYRHIGCQSDLTDQHAPTLIQTHWLSVRSLQISMLRPLYRHIGCQSDLTDQHAPTLIQTHWLSVRPYRSACSDPYTDTLAVSQTLQISMLRPLYRHIGCQSDLTDQHAPTLIQTHWLSVRPYRSACSDPYTDTLAVRQTLQISMLRPLYRHIGCQSDLTDQHAPTLIQTHWLSVRPYRSACSDPYTDTLAVSQTLQISMLRPLYRHIGCQSDLTDQHAPTLIQTHWLSVDLRSASHWLSDRPYRSACSDPYTDTLAVSQTLQISMLRPLYRHIGCQSDLTDQHAPTLIQTHWLSGRPYRSACSNPYTDTLAVRQTLQISMLRPLYKHIGCQSDLTDQHAPTLIQTHWLSVRPYRSACSNPYTDTLAVRQTLQISMLQPLYKHIGCQADRQTCRQKTQRLKMRRDKTMNQRTRLSGCLISGR